jgi:hypothetical protein
MRVQRRLAGSRQAPERLAALLLERGGEVKIRSTKWLPCSLSVPNHFPFCERCGIQVFVRGSLPELGGEYVSINVNCIGDIDLAKSKVVYWDGRHDNWQAGSRDTPWPVAT